MKLCEKLASVYIKLVHGNQALNFFFYFFFLNSYFVFSVDQVVIHEMMIQLWTWALLSAIDSWYVTGNMLCSSYCVPCIAVVCCKLYSLELKTDPQYQTLLLICCKHWAVITDLHISFNEFGTRTAHTNKRSVVWSWRCILLINKHASFTLLTWCPYYAHILSYYLSSSAVRRCH